MNILQRILLFILSAILLIVVVVPYGILGDLINKYYIAQPIYIKAVVILVGISLAVFGLFSRVKKEEKHDGIVLENNSGRLLISTQTLENLVKDVSKEIPGLESSQVRITLDKSNNVAVIVDAVVNKNVTIKEAIRLLQDSAIESIKKASDLEVKQINVNIKNITNRSLSKKEEENAKELGILEVVESKEEKEVQTEENTTQIVQEAKKESEE